MRSWVFLLYKLPPEPSAPRVHVWRKLKRLGAILLHDAVWVLPATPATIEQLQWLAQEIVEFDGSATVWEARASLPQQDEALMRQFTTQADAAYQEIQVELERPGADLAALTRRYRQVQALDYFNSESGRQVRHALKHVRQVT
jgi:ChrB-like protein